MSNPTELNPEPEWRPWDVGGGHSRGTTSGLLDLMRPETRSTGNGGQPLKSAD